jgi:DNA-binding HxlR family transcriptional regulator
LLSFRFVGTSRTYGDGCAIAHGLDLVGERWALLVVRELLLGPKRFTDLKRGLPNASPNVISERLRELERAGVVQRAKLPPPASAHVYELTEWGRTLEPVVFALGRWASRSPSLPDDAPIGPDSVVLELKSRFDAHAAEGVNAAYELRFGEERFHVVVVDGALQIARGGVERPDATIDTDPATFFAALSGGAGDLGHPDAVARLLHLFPAPG